MTSVSWQDWFYVIFFTSSVTALLDRALIQQCCSLKPQVRMLISISAINPMPTELFPLYVGMKLSSFF